MRNSFCFYTVIYLGRQNLVAGDAKQHKSQSAVTRGKCALVCWPYGPAFLIAGTDFLFCGFCKAIGKDIFFTLLINGGIHKITYQSRGRSVDGHGYRSGCIAEIETGIEFFGIVEACNGNTGITDLAVNIRTQAGVGAIKGY